MDDPKRNITGSYPGAGGSSRPRKANPAGAYPGARRAPAEEKAAPRKAEEKSSVPRAEEPVRAKPRRAARKKAESGESSGEKKRFKWSKDTLKLYGKTLAFYGIIFVVSVLLAAWICHIGNEVLGLIRPDHEYTVTIAENSSTMTIAKELQKAGILDHPYVFRFYCKLKKADGTFQFGEYTINRNRDYNQIISALRRSAAEKTMVKFTVKPGETQEDFVTLLCDSLGYLKREELENVLQNYDFSDYDFLKNLPERNYRLEGYLLPGEYEMAEGESALAVVHRILDAFAEQVLTEENLALIRSSGYTADQIVTLASVLQKEAAGEYEKAAGVLWNRLKDKSYAYLESQATVAYVLPAVNSTVGAAEIRIEDPYNTYRNQGLPPGPICNPGLEAIAAVLKPEQHDLLYFVCGEDGKMYYATDEAGHLGNRKTAGEPMRGTKTVY